LSNDPFSGDDDVAAALLAVGELLQASGAQYAVVVIGGAALQLLGVISRTTGDVEMIAFVAPGATRTQLIRPPAQLPAPLQRAILAVAKDRNLPPDWLNTGPAGQWDLPSPLPPGFENRVIWRSFAALDVGIAHRRDCISLKLEAAADHLDTGHPTSNRHFLDLVALAPTQNEFEVAANWVKGNNDSEFHAKVDYVVSLISHERNP
jgi:hypothetical protein